MCEVKEVIVEKKTVINNLEIRKYPDYRINNKNEKM